jgi:16S rRNA (adenine1518-N6/adenine1519-N6)-dimethyltransferase
VARRLGQHFLTDPAILDRIVNAINPQPDDVVIEIGPGQGSLTQRLASRVGRVIAIERDAKLAALLKGARSGERGADPAGKRMPENVRIVHGDALKLDWHAELEPTPEISAPRSPLPAPSRPLPAPSFKVVGNIPYYITTPLIDKALTPPPPRVIVFLVQREVAERLGAGPGSKSYGALTVGVRSVASVERLFVVRAGSFTPPPQVDSALVRIEPCAQPLLPYDEIAAFRRFNATLFSQRRKQLRRILRSIRLIGSAEVESELARCNIDPTARPETLSPEDIVHVFRSFRP